MREKETNRFEKVSFEQFSKDFNNLFHADGSSDWNEEMIHVIYDSIKLPTRKTRDSAGYDFTFPTPIIFDHTHNIVTIPTGIKVKLKKNRFLQIVPRSSLGFKYQCMLSNTLGIIDRDYYNNADNEGHIMVKLWCPTRSEFTIESYKGYCQGIILSYDTTEDDETSSERVGGIGSTDNE